ncbi:hypothetical protein JRO89_XS05G0001000 [Xanthoceras sorbifolium]|uniref:Thioredoxin domain-containing protein n=1 Tax=Xanthoceras sorbifolium TaxID=99658 RepID=A0ABQ8HZJ7_9ROSI|nr:hypothetical protein JRO89_XS05G0001000 [Xanthoceras sorbifolium]
MCKMDIQALQPSWQSTPDGLLGHGILTVMDFATLSRLRRMLLLSCFIRWNNSSRSNVNAFDRVLVVVEELRSLKLMIIYRNSEKMLADAIGATEPITVMFYHHSVSFKYRGRLRALNILHSIYPYISVSPEEVPIKSINSLVDLKEFIDSTDKAFILFDFCGWTPNLQARANDNTTAQGNHFGLLFNDNANIQRKKGNEKGIENGNLKCGIGNGFGGIPWLGEFSSANDSDPFQETQNMMSGVGLSCNFKEFQQFESFYSKFMTAAREFFLPPERHRFGLVSERSLLQYLGIEDSDSWLAILYLAGCPDCSKILKEGSDLKDALQMNNEVVAEVNLHFLRGTRLIEARRPKFILSISSHYSKYIKKKKSKYHVLTFYILFLQLYIPFMEYQDLSSVYSIGVEYKVACLIFKLDIFMVSFVLLLVIYSKFYLFNDRILQQYLVVVIDHLAHQKPEIKLKDKISWHEILYLLQKKREAKLSQLAKEVGFNLLSDDIDLKIVDASPLQTEVHSDSVSSIPPEEGLVNNIIESDKDQFDGRSNGDSKSTFVLPSHHDEEKAFSVDTNEQLISELPEHLPDRYLTNAKDVKVEEKSSSQEYKLGEPQLQFQGFRGSFFFCDANYRLLRALTGGSTIPSLVIVDPISQQHYVFPKETTFGYYSMAGFLHGFLNGSLLPYQSSESMLQSFREATHPPFVNMDFHDVDSIPRVTAHTFSELVLGLNQSDYKNASNAWNEDVLVLFSSGWCGFCLRMELVVREVYRATKGYIKMLKNGYKNGETDFSGDNLKNVVSRIPRIFLMDCTLNDCSLILKSTSQRELYPALILFPAERKNAVSYDGDIAVADIVKFMADHGNNSRHLISGKGHLLTSIDKGARHGDKFEGRSSAIDHDNDIVIKESFHEVVLKSMTPQRGNRDSEIKSQTSKGLHEISQKVVVGCVLIATDKIVNLEPFDNSKILLVKADKDIGVEGLILNKHISWEALNEIKEELEFLKKAPLSFGGPLIKQGMPFLCLTRSVTKSQYPELEVVSGVYFLDQLATVNEIEELKHGNHSVADYWFFLGYSRWDWNQVWDFKSKIAEQLHIHYIENFSLQSL